MQILPLSCDIKRVLADGQEVWTSDPCRVAVHLNDHYAFYALETKSRGYIPENDTWSHVPGRLLKRKFHKF